jgi:uncharacterized protein
MAGARMLVALVAGALFGAGLAISGMMHPAKVVGFLDFAGTWDPTLIFVMGGALLVCVPAFRIVLGRPRPVLADGFALPTKTALDARLLGGAALFGVGWGLSGFCPGPAVAALVPALASEIVPALVFFAAMISSMALYGWTFERRERGGTRATPPVGSGSRIVQRPVPTAARSSTRRQPATSPDLLSSDQVR